MISPFLRIRLLTYGYYFAFSNKAIQDAQEHESMYMQIHQETA